MLRIKLEYMLQMIQETMPRPHMNQLIFILMMLVLMKILIIWLLLMKISPLMLRMLKMKMIQRIHRGRKRRYLIGDSMYISKEALKMIQKRRLRLRGKRWWNKRRKMWKKEGSRKSSKLMEKSKIISSTETPKETESINKGKANDEGCEDTSGLSPKIEEQRRHNSQM